MLIRQTKAVKWPPPPAHIHTLIAAAKEDFLTHIEQVSKLFAPEALKPPWGFHPTVLRRLCHFYCFSLLQRRLRRHYGGRKANEDDELKVARCSCALNTICLATSPNYRNLAPDFAETYLLQALPQIFQWIEFFYYFGCDDMAFGSKQRNMTSVSRIQMILLSLVTLSDFKNFKTAGGTDRTNETPFSKELRRLPGLFRIILEMFALQRDLHRPEYKEICFICHWLFGQPIAAADVAALNRGLGLARSELVSLLLRPIRHVLYNTRDAASLDILAVVASIYMHFSVHLREMFRMFVRGGLMFDVLHNVSLLLSLTEVSKANQATLELVFYLVYQMAQAMDGNKRWVREALHLGLIRHLMEYLSHPEASEAWAGATRHFFAETIIPAAVHPSLVPKFFKAVRVFTPPPPRPASPQVTSLCADFVRLAMDMEVFMMWRDDFQALERFRMECSSARGSVFEQGNWGALSMLWRL
ncbi:hypothetical protein H0H92_014286 [Tricholoma furcatifolium]|nr:hypothetical protein H0H92_014286 [Tricholoma furcatifolium]